MTPRGAPRRFYYAGRVPPVGQDAPRVELSPEESRHLRLVLRLGRGDAVELFDADGRGFLAEVDDLSERGAARLRVVQAIEGAAQAAGGAGPAINLAVAMLKRRAMDLMIEKLSELGVGVLQPLLTRRCIALGDVKPGEPPPDRWERLAIAAAKQSGRNRPLRASAPMRLRDWLSRSGPSSGGAIDGGDVGDVGPWRNAAFGHLVPSAPTLGAWLRGLRESDAATDASAGAAESSIVAPATPIWFAIGPEGGWADEETEALMQAGFAPVNLGDLTLRAETAAIAVAAACRLL